MMNPVFWLVWPKIAFADVGHVWVLTSWNSM